MHILLAADHRGYELKQKIVGYLSEKNVSFEDCGAHEYQELDDFTDFADLVAGKISEDPSLFGILLCGSGEGMAIYANKFKNVRAAMVWQPELATTSRAHNNANILVFPADFISEEIAFVSIEAFLNTPFDAQEKRLRRLEKISILENKNHAN